MEDQHYRPYQTPINLPIKPKNKAPEAAQNIKKYFDIDLPNIKDYFRFDLLVNRKIVKKDNKAFSKQLTQKIIF